MPKSCPPGTIRRASYTRKAHRRSNGTSVKGAHVPASCIKDLGKSGKGKRLFTLKKGGLRKYGYILSETQDNRRSALINAMDDGMSIGYLWKRLNAIQILHRNTNPKTAKKIKSDMEWLRFKYKRMNVDDKGRKLSSSGDDLDNHIRVQSCGGFQIYYNDKFEPPKGASATDPLEKNLMKE